MSELARERAAALRREARWRTWRDDPVKFIEEACFIRVPGKGRVRPVLRTPQRETLVAIQSERYLIILKSRQIGYSTLMALYSLWFCMFHSDKFVLFLSKGEREAMKLLAKAAYAYKHLPTWVKLRGPNVITNNLLKLSFDNDSTIESQPSKEDPGRGESVDLVVIDEWAYLDNPEEAWAAIEPTTDIGGRVIGLSTARGWGEFFHGMYVSAAQGNNTFKRLFYGWDAVPERDAEWYERQKRKYANTPHLLAQEYPSNEDEAFIQSGRTVFDVALLRGIPTTDPQAVGYFLAPRGPRSFEWQATGTGFVSMWEPPVWGEQYVMGADVAEGLEYGDFSAAHVIHNRSGLVVATWHGHVDPDLFGLELAWLGWHYNTALLGVEKNNHGLTTLTALKRLGYQRLYYRHVLDQRTTKRQRTMGWYTTASNKGLMIGELWAAVRDGEIELRCAPTIAEMKTYVRDENGKMGGSPHDDRVMSLAIAQQMRRHVLDFDAVEEPDITGTLNWWRQMADDIESARRPPKRIGAHNLR